MGSGFSVGVVRKRVSFAVFGCSFMMSSPGQWAKIVAQSLVRLESESLEPLMDFLRFLAPKLEPEDPKSLRIIWLSNFMDFAN